MNSENKTDGLLKPFAVVAAVSLIFYSVGFSWIQHRRTARGPWQVEFQAGAGGAPSLVISQTNLNVFETIVFPTNKVSAQNLPRTVRFEPNAADIPFGEVKYQDSMYLPGTVTLELFGHEIELIPRVLKIDAREYSWQSGGTLEVH